MSNDALTLAQMRPELRGVRAELRRVRRELTRAHAENIHYRHVLEDVARTAKTSVDSGYSLRGLRLAYIARITRPFRPDGGDTRDAERLSENARLVEMLMRQVNVWTERFCSDPDATDEQRCISQLLGEAIGRAQVEADLGPQDDWTDEDTESRPIEREHPHAGSEEAPALPPDDRGLRGPAITAGERPATAGGWQVNTHRAAAWVGRHARPGARRPAASRRARPTATRRAPRSRRTSATPRMTTRP